MNPELHVDDLLDKEARGELTHAERVRLDHHLSACSICCFERQVREDFRIEFESLGAAEQRSFKGQRTTTTRSGALSERRRRGRTRAGLWLLAAAGMLMTGAAAAEWHSLRRVVFESPLLNWRPSPHIAGESTRSAGPGVPATVCDVVAAPPPSTEVSPAPPAATDHEPLESDSSRVAAPRIAKAPSLGPVPAAGIASEPDPAAQGSGAALFAEASEARKRGAYDEAIRLYGELLRLFPSSTEAAASHLIRGKLLLDEGDPSRALPDFDAYLASRRAGLLEEALVGRAQALAMLGRPAEETDAWSKLLAAFPASVHAMRARTRLASLGNR